MTFSSDYAVLTQGSVFVRNVPDSYVLRGFVTPVTVPELEVRYYQRYKTASGIIPLWPVTQRFPGFQHQGEVIRINADYLPTADQEKLRQLKQQATWGWYQYIGALFLACCLLFGAFSAHFDARKREEQLQNLVAGDVLAIEDSVDYGGVRKVLFYKVAEVNETTVLLYKARFEGTIRTEFKPEKHEESVQDTTVYDAADNENLRLSKEALAQLEYRIRHVYRQEEN